MFSKRWDRLAGRWYNNEEGRTSDDGASASVKVNTDSFVTLRSTAKPWRRRR